MPFDGSGNYTPAPSPNFPAVGGTPISAVYYNAVINDIVAALSNTLTRDGQGKPSAAIDWNAKNLVNVAVFGAASGSFSGALSVGTLSSTTAAFSGAVSAASLTLTTALAVAQGGTGATTAAAARTNLGATTLGANIFTLANVSAIRFLQINADNTLTALDAAGFRSAIGAGTGTVSSVSGAGTVNGLTLTGSVTSSGSLTLGGTLTGVSLTSAVTGVLPIANGGTGGSTAATARTALGAAASGANGDITSLRQDTTIAASGTIAPNSIGFRGLPASSQAMGSTITLALDDAGKKVKNTAGGWTIPANASVAFPVDTAIVLHNRSASPQTITINGGDTLRLAGTTSTGTRTVAPWGYATLNKEATTEWEVGGNVT